MNKNYFAILGVESNATDDEIKKAYRKFALKFHPDKNKSMSAIDHFKQVAEAYFVLCDKTKREVLQKYFKEISNIVDNSFDWNAVDEQEINREQFSFSFNNNPQINTSQATLAEILLKPNIWNNHVYYQRQSSQSTWTSNN